MPTVKLHAPATCFRAPVTRDAAGTVKVDREKRTINGYAVITRGEALGHYAWIDGQTLQQVVELGNSAGPGIKARFSHPSLSGDGLGKFLGRARNFRQDGDVVRADLHLADIGDKAPDGQLATYVMDMAEEDPKAFGSSIVFEHDGAAEEQHRVENTRKGAFVSPDPRNDKNLPHMRVLRLRASDVVDEPAANPSGFFSDASELVSNADEFCAWLCGLSAIAPSTSMLGGVSPQRVKVYFDGFLAKNGLAVQKRENPMKVVHEVACLDCEKKFAVPGEKGKFDAHEVECPYCSKKFDFTPPDPDAKPETQDEPSDEPKDNKKTQASRPVNVDEIRREEQEKAAAYNKQFEAAMDAAGLKGDGREAFRKEYHGEEVRIVRKFALLTAGGRTQPVGEGGGVQTEEPSGSLDASKLAPFVERFKSSKGLRRAYKCGSDDPESDEYKAALKRYLKSVKI